MASYDQPMGGEQLTSNGKKLRTYVVKGDYATLQTAANSRTRGTLITDHGYVLSWNLQRIPGGAMCTYQLANVTSEQWTANDALDDTWSLRHMRVDVPIQRYGGPSEGANANLYDLARWQTEPDRTLYVSWQYRTETGSVVTLSDQTQLLAAKIKCGHQSVQRHFPTAIRTRIYAAEPTDDVGDLIDYIDTPGHFSDAATAWLKIQDDVSQQGDGNWIRVESWMGAEDWDENFYGSTSRWEFGTI